MSKVKANTNVSANTNVNSNADTGAAAWVLACWGSWEAGKGSWKLESKEAEPSWLGGLIFYLCREWRSIGESQRHAKL
jgi:hypothetical protein